MKPEFDHSSAVPSQNDNILLHHSEDQGRSPHDYDSPNAALTEKICTTHSRTVVKPTTIRGTSTELGCGIYLRPKPNRSHATHSVHDSVPGLENPPLSTDQDSGNLKNKPVKGGEGGEIDKLTEATANRGRTGKQSTHQNASSLNNHPTLIPASHAGQQSEEFGLANTDTLSVKSGYCSDIPALG